jgi:hypothetical protein
VVTVGSATPAILVTLNLFWEIFFLIFVVGIWDSIINLFSVNREPFSCYRQPFLFYMRQPGTIFVMKQLGPSKK